MKRHVIVIGDLYVDHDIFVTRLENMPDSGASEPRLNVVQRQNTAGGAANSARIISVLNDGDTYLWGIVGSTHWGTFRHVLESSHATDAVRRSIELRGVADETDPPMNTVNRILVVSEEDPQLVQAEFCRYYDINHVHVPRVKRETLLYHLDRIQDKSPLHAVVINDFGRGALTKSLIESIAQRAAHYGVPLFLDPLLVQAEEDKRRYLGIKGTAIMPNLAEWCALVDDDRGAGHWRRNLNSPKSLQEMAEKSFEHLGNFEYHIVKCDRDGAVLFVPHPSKRNEYGLYHFSPVPTRSPGQRLQTGNGDVMMGMFALAFPQGSPTTDGVLRAFHSANVGVACYRDMPWHKMPHRREVEERQRDSKWEHVPPDAEITKAVLFLPREARVDMVTHETAVKGLFSQDHVFRKTVQEFMNDITSEWTSGSTKSLVLGARPGTGKTTIMNAVEMCGASSGIRTLNMSSTEHGTALHMMEPAAFRDYFRKLGVSRAEEQSRDGGTESRGEVRRGVLILVDEALKEPTCAFLKNHAATLLIAAHAENVRFLFLSKEFKPELEQADEWRELFGRTRTYYLSSLEDRPFDIPYIIAARFFEQRDNLQRLDIDGRFLLAVTDFALITPEPREICVIVDDVLNRNAASGPEWAVNLEHLPDKYLKNRALPSTGRFSRYEFHR